MRDSNSASLITATSREEADEDDPPDLLEEDFGVLSLSFFLLAASSCLCFSRYSFESCRSFEVVFLSELFFSDFAALRRFSASAARAFVSAPSRVLILVLSRATRAVACCGVSLVVVFAELLGRGGGRPLVEVAAVRPVGRPLGAGLEPFGRPLSCRFLKYRSRRTAGSYFRGS